MNMDYEEKGNGMGRGWVVGGGELSHVVMMKP